MNGSIIIKARPEDDTMPLYWTGFTWASNPCYAREYKGVGASIAIRALSRPECRAAKILSTFKAPGTRFQFFLNVKTENGPRQGFKALVTGRNAGPASSNQAR